MNPRAITDLQTVLDWAPPFQQVDERTAATLRRCIEAASWAIEATCRRRFAADGYRATHSGDRAARVDDYLYLVDNEAMYATFPVQADLFVIENGVQLQASDTVNIATLTDGEYAVVHNGTGRLSRVSVSGISRRRLSWAPGFANIVTIYAAGYEPTSMPGDIVQVCAELAWLMYREGQRNGLESLVQAGTNVTFVRLLSPFAQRILDGYTLRSPQTVER